MGAGLFSNPLLSDPWFYAAAIPAVIAVGMAKGGISGLGILGVPILALAISPVQAAAIILPILIVQDVVSIWVFRGLWSLRLVAILMIGGMAGVALGYGLAASVSTPAVELSLGAICIAFGTQRIWQEWKGGEPRTSPAPDWIGVIFGVVAGFTSQIAHAGGPPVQIFLMQRRVERDLFLGTSTLFFAILNWVKVPAYLALGQFTPDNLGAALVLFPLAVISTLAGARLARSLTGRTFFRVTYVLMVLLGLKLAWDGAHALWLARG
ncbi:MAG TPA: sulfite exporter TauE/SafE family protein [Caulobacterales bacterium]|nr:sulfite exporter TauE/SafE family protein [Caulobacterales bacterium]